VYDYAAIFLQIAFFLLELTIKPSLNPALTLALSLPLIFIRLSLSTNPLLTFKITN